MKTKEDCQKLPTNKHFLSRNCQVFSLIQSLLLLVNGLFWLFIFPVVFEEILESKIVIKPGTIGYEAWKKPNIPTKIRYLQSLNCQYLHNCSLFKDLPLFCKKST